MLKKLTLVAALAATAFTLPVGLTAVVLFTPTTCVGTDESLHVGPVPDSLVVSGADGKRLTLEKGQLEQAATIIDVGGATPEVGRAGVQIALMAALTESKLRMLANTSAYPDSARYPHDGDGHDHDSLGTFQMRPRAGWGSSAHLMDPRYQAAAFFGGPAGPNHGSPRGLLDIANWHDLDPGTAAQAVEVSAFPDRYRAYQPAAEQILDALLTPQSPQATEPSASGQTVFPLPAGTWRKESPFGLRIDPVNGRLKLHTGTDYAAPLGTPILAIAAGTVTVARPDPSYGNLIVIEHHINGQLIASAYAHERHIDVTVGQTVTAGEPIADVGTEGHSTGPHLHFEIRPGGTTAPAIDPNQWLAAAGVHQLEAPRTAAACGAT